jgi:hypothetical protein
MIEKLLNGTTEYNCKILKVTLGYFQVPKATYYMVVLGHTALQQLQMVMFTMLHLLGVMVVINVTTGTVTVLNPATQDQGARRGGRSENSLLILPLKSHLVHLVAKMFP